MTIFGKLLRSELRLFFREPVLAFFVVAFPTLLCVILGSIPSFREASPDLGGLRVVDLYVPILVAMTLAFLGLQTAPAVLATYREKGVLRRLATTPAKPVLLLAAQLAMGMVIAVCSAAMVMLVGRFAFQVAFPDNVFAFVVSFLLAAAGVFAVGMFIAAVARTGKAANGIGTFLFFPSMFFAGLWAPRETLPAILARIGDFTPLGAGVQAMSDATAGQWPALIAVTVLVAYFAVFGVAAARLFRWE